MNGHVCAESVMEQQYIQEAKAELVGRSLASSESCVLSYRPQGFSLGTLDVLGHVILHYGRLSYALYGV